MTFHPTRTEVRRIADLLRARNHAAEQHGEDLITAAWLRQQSREAIADYIAELRVPRKRGGQSHTWYQDANTCVFWLLINRRIAYWRRVAERWHGRQRPWRRPPRDRQGTLERALRKVADETGYEPSTLRRNWDKYGDRLEASIADLINIVGRELRKRDSLNDRR